MEGANAFEQVVLAEPPVRDDGDLAGEDDLVEFAGTDRVACAPDPGEEVLVGTDRVDPETIGCFSVAVFGVVRGGDGELQALNGRRDVLIPPDGDDCGVASFGDDHRQPGDDEHAGCCGIEGERAEREGPGAHPGVVVSGDRGEEPVGPLRRSRLGGAAGELDLGRHTPGEHRRAVALDHPSVAEGEPTCRRHEIGAEGAAPRQWRAPAASCLPSEPVRRAGVLMPDPRRERAPWAVA